MKYYKLYLYLPILLILGSCQQPLTVSKVKGELVTVEEVVPEEEYNTLIEPYKVQLDSIMNEIIGFSENEMEKGKPEGLLGNFVADLLLQVGNKYYKSNKPIDFCIINNGGLRTFLPKGKITRKKIYELMPFENELVIITLDQRGLEKMFSFIANKGGAPISGFTLEILKNKKYKVKVGGQEITDRNYKVLTSDYLAAGGSRMTFFADSIKMESLNLKVREAIIEFIIDENKRGKKVNAELDKRVFYAE